MAALSEPATTSCFTASVALLAPGSASQWRLSLPQASGSESKWRESESQLEASAPSVSPCPRVLLLSGAESESLFVEAPSGAGE